MGKGSRAILFLCAIVLVTGIKATAQESANDTIRLGAVTENGHVYPMVLLPEFERTGQLINQEERTRRDKLRNDIYTVYPYALAAATVFKDVNKTLDSLPDRHDRKVYLKTIDKKLDKIFKQPLKNTSIDQGHVLIKLIDRQTGENCYTIIKELKGGFSAVVWQSVGVFFNNNLHHDYDPEGTDKEIEDIVKGLEASNLYRYQLYQQEALLKKISKP